jgi:hypothetical protein
LRHFFTPAFTVILCILLSGNAYAVNDEHARATKIFVDTTATGHVKIHHFIELGLIAQLGNQYVRTYNDYEHATYSYNNNIVQQDARFFSIRFGHEVLLKNVIATGITYGADVSIEPHDIRAFVPLLLHVSKTIIVTKKLGLFFSERVGYSFYIRSTSDNPLIQYTGVEGGFTSETIAGLSVPVGHTAAIQFFPGYHMQHLNSKMIFTPALSNLPEKIREVTNGFYNFFYFTVGISF